MEKSKSNSKATTPQKGAPAIRGNGKTTVSKKPVPVKMVNNKVAVKSMPKKETEKRERNISWEAIILAAFLFVLAVINEMAFKHDSELVFAVGAAVIFVVMCLKKANRELLYKRITPILLAIFAQCLLYFAGLFYADYPRFALQQFLINMGVLFIFGTVYISVSRNGRNTQRILTAFAVCVAVVSIISLEMATSGYSRNAFLAVVRMLGANISSTLGTFETNTRLIPLTGDPNAFSSIAVLAMFLSLWSCGTPGQRDKKTIIHMGLAIICGSAFLLCLSLGIIAAYVFALIAIILLTKKENRKAALISNIFCIIVSMAEAAIVFKFLSTGLMPVLTVIVMSTAFAYLYAYVKPLKARKPVVLAKNRKIITAGIIAVVVVAIAAVSLLRGSYDLKQGDSFRRAVALPSGDYSMNIEYDSAQASSVSVQISSMSYTQAALKEKTAIETVSPVVGEEVKFTVPDSSAVVIFTFTAADNVKISDVKIVGEKTTKDISLHYLIVPEFIVNRLQGFWANDNFMQRLIFFRDGIRLGMKSPVIGLGGGAFEGGVFSVADYYYETVHPHNQCIQSFIDGGIVGLLIFLSIYVLIFIGIHKSRKSGKMSKLLPVLGGCAIFVFMQSMLEVSFFYPMFMISAAILFAITAAECDFTVMVKGTVNKILKVSFAALAIVSVLLSAGESITDNMFTENITLDKFQTATILDPVNRSGYQISYLLNSIDASMPSVVTQSKRYEADLDKKTIYDEILLYLTKYYLSKSGSEAETQKATEFAERYIHMERVNTDSWDDTFMLYDKTLNSYEDDLTKAKQVAESAINLGAYLSELNKELPKKTSPGLASFTYVRAGLLLSGENDTYFDSRRPCDLDGDGISDYLVKGAGAADNTVEWKLKTYIPQKDLFTVRIYQAESFSCEIVFNGSAYQCSYDSEKGCYVVRITASEYSADELSVKTNDSSAGVYFTIEKTTY